MPGRSPCLRDFGRSRVVHAEEPLEEARNRLGGNPAAGIANGELDRVAVFHRPQKHGDAAFERVLQRIRQQVQDDALPGIAVDRDLCALELTGHGQREPRPVRSGFELPHQLAGEGLQVDAFEERVGTSGLVPHELQELIDELEQSNRAVSYELYPVPLLPRQRTKGISQRILERPEHQGERCAQFMADVGEEPGL